MEKTPEEKILEIKGLINQMVTAVSPAKVADLRVELAGYKAWLGEILISSEMTYNSELNEAMNKFDLPAAKAKIQIQATDTYRKYATIRQLYRDLQTVVSAARTKLAILEDERRNY